MTNTFEHSDLRGIMPSMLTPLTNDDALDRPAVRRQVEYLLAGGVRSLWLGGTGGEVFAIGDDVLHDLACEAADCVRDANIPIMANASACGTRIAIRRAEQFAKVRIAVASSVPPFYFSYGQEDIIHYYQALSRHSPIPVIIYNNPFVGSKFDVTPSVVQVLIQEPNIIGIKDCCGKAGRVQELLHLRAREGRPEFLVYESWEPWVAQSLLDGADGAIMSAGSILPRLCIDLWNACQQKDASRALELQQQVDDFINSFCVDGIFPDELFIGGTKACQEMLGIGSRRTAHPHQPWPAMNDHLLQSILQKHELVGVHRSVI